MDDYGPFFIRDATTLYLDTSKLGSFHPTRVRISFAVTERGTLASELFAQAEKIEGTASLYGGA